MTKQLNPVGSVIQFTQGQKTMNTNSSKGKDLEYIHRLDV